MLQNLASKNYSDEYKNNFGDTPICKQLYLGLKKSFDAYYREKEDSKEYNELSTALTDLLNKIDSNILNNNTPIFSIHRNNNRIKYKI